MRKYHHLGIPTTVSRPGESHLKKLGVHCTQHDSNPFGIQWMRFDPECTAPILVKTLPHVAFEVDDLARELEGRTVLIPPNSPSEGVVVAFIVEDGAPVEFLQFTGRRGVKPGAGVRKKSATKPKPTRRRRASDRRSPRR